MTRWFSESHGQYGRPSVSHIAVRIESRKSDECRRLHDDVGAGIVHVADNMLTVQNPNTMMQRNALVITVTM